MIHVSWREARNRLVLLALGAACGALVTEFLVRQLWRDFAPRYGTFEIAADGSLGPVEALRYDPRIGWRYEAMRILSEWQRYEIYAGIELGLPNLILGIAMLWLIRRASRNRWEWLTVGIAPVLFMIFLSAYGAKYRPRYLATAIAL